MKGTANKGYNTKFYHMSNSRNVQESMGKPCKYMQVIKTHIFYYESCENLYQVLQVTCATPEHAMKSKKLLSP